MKCDSCNQCGGCCPGAGDRPVGDCGAVFCDEECYTMHTETCEMCKNGMEIASI